MRREPDLHFEPLDACHFDMVGEWLAQLHVRRWWGDPDHEMALIREGLASGGVEAFIVRIDGRPIAYVQSWHPANYEEIGWGRLVGDATVGIDIFVGPADAVGKGFGALIVEAFARKLRAEGAPRVIIDPDAANAGAIRAYAKAGFVPFRRWSDQEGETMLMEFAA